jgi:hypothetical protein
VIADNIIRVRKASKPRVSQQTLATRMGAIDGGSSNRSRVADLETGREGRPRPASWQDVVTVALALDVPVKEIVLPTKGSQMILAEPTVAVRDEGGKFSLSKGPVIVDRNGAIECFGGRYGSIQEEISSMRAELYQNKQELLETLERFSNTVIHRSSSDTSVEVPIPPLDESESI